MARPDESGEQRARSPLQYAGLGVQLAAALVLCALGGQWLDRKVGTDGVFTIAGAFLGFGATMYWLIGQLTRSDRPKS